MIINYQNRWLDKSYIDKILNIPPLSRKINYNLPEGDLMKTLEQQIYQGQLNKIYDYEISNENYYIIANRHCYSNKIEINIELFNRENNYYQVLSIRKNINSIEQINKIIDAFENLLKVLE